MTEEHERYERLVVGHVLGDLVAPEAGRFRSHLMACQDCRSRVAELRGIAADLAEAERDELERSHVRTAAPRRLGGPDGGQVDAPVDPPLRASRITVRHVTTATVAVIVLAAAMGFWNLHLRATAVHHLTVADAGAESLAGLADGVLLEPQLRDGVGGIVASDGQTVSLSLTRLGPLDDAQLLVAWFVGGDDGEATAVPLARAGAVDDGHLAVTLDDPGATELVVTRERGEPGVEPSDAEVLRVDLLGGG